MKSSGSLFLYSPHEIVATRTWDNIDHHDLPYYLLALWWAETFLTRPHQDLGRSGPTCPFVRKSLDSASLWLTTIKIDELDKTSLIENLIGYKNWFPEIEPKDEDYRIFKTIIILFPNLNEEQYSMLDIVQNSLKNEFLKNGMMLGQFHANCEEEGIRNPSFRPLKSPMPLLAIRYITPGDVVFMKKADGKYDYDYLKSYFGTFATTLPKSLVTEICQIMAEHDTPIK